MSRIRSRLILAFVVVAMLPAVPLAILVRDLLERSFSPPFASESVAALEAALEDQRARLHAERAAFRADLESGAAGAEAGDMEFRAGDADIPAPLREWAAAAAGSAATGSAAAGAAPTVRVGGWLAATLPDGRHIARPLPEGLEQRAAQVTETIALLRAFREERTAVLRGFVGPFLLSYALLIAVAVGVGAMIARRIARPVEALAAGAARVGAGDLATRVDVPAGGEVGRLVDAFNRMVADLDAQRDELARLERVAAWRDLARSLAHEIKNPLTPIQLAVQQLGDRFPRKGAADDAGVADSAADGAAPAPTSPAEYAEYAALLDECVSIVDEEVAALRKLVREFSEFARLPQPQPGPGDLGQLLDEIVRLYGEERTVRHGAGPLNAHFDAAEMKRALINLVDNGLAACREAGRPERVELAAARVKPAAGAAGAGGAAGAAGAPGASGAGASVEIRIRDAGCGIPDANRARVFEPNFSTKTEGMGLGLAIVDGIVRGHGGTITVESRPGEGTEFRILIPEEER